MWPFQTKQLSAYLSNQGLLAWVTPKEKGQAKLQELSAIELEELIHSIDTDSRLPATFKRHTEQQLLQKKLVEARTIKPATLEKKLQSYWTESKADWAGLFSTLEESKNSDITLLSVDPRLSEQRVLISGLARNQETLNFYLTKLESSKALSQVELQRYRRTTNSPNGLEFFAVTNWIAHD